MKICIWYNLFNWGMPKTFEDLKCEKRSKSGNFRANFGRISGEKVPFLFVTYCYIWAFSG